MHRRLRRQLEEALGQEPEASPPLRRLLRKVDKEYRKADGARESLQHALALLSDLLHGQSGAQPRRAGSAKARSVERLFDQAPLPSLVCNADRKVTAWNAAAERLFGIPAAEALGRELSMLVFAGADLEAAQARTILRQALASAESAPLVQLTPNRSGPPRMCEWTILSLRDGKGREVGNAALVQEKDPLRDRYARACEAAGDGLWEWDLEADRLWLSESWRSIVGAKDPDDAPSQWIDRVHPDEREGVQAAIRAHLEGGSQRFESEHRLRHEDGGWRWVLVRGQAARDAAGKAVRFSGSSIDVTGPRSGEAPLRDALTGLPNRPHFLEQAQRSFARVRRREAEQIAVLAVEVDALQTVLQRTGRAAADQLLVEVSARLRQCLRDGDALARPGGGEFALLLEDVRDGAEAERAAERIHGAFAEPIEIAGQKLAATVSIGIAVSGPVYGSAEDLVLDAGTAMARAQAQGRGQSVLFDSAVRERTPHLLELEADLRKALARDEFLVQYLPIVDVPSGRIGGFEALIRWAHPTRGLLAPDQFMPFAEETGLSVLIGGWLLGRASREFQACRGVGPEEMTLNLNLSSRQLQHVDLLEHVDTVLSEHALEPRKIAFELTENLLQQGQHAPRIAELRERGVQVYMDDFGTGSCSLNSLMRYQFDCLKIDRSLFSGGAPRGKAPELVRTIVSLAHDLGTRVIAEGVETEEQLGFLREVGCSAAQGSFFSPPVDAVAARALLEKRAG